MTEFACPVCATPYQAGAATCAFCGVSLVEPEPKAEADATVEIESTMEATPEMEAAAEPARETATHAIDETDGIVELDDLAEVQPGDIDATEPDTAEPASGIATIDEDARAEVEAGDAANDEETVAATSENVEIPVDSVPEVSVAPPEPHSKTPSFANTPTTASAAQHRLQRTEWSIVGGLAVLLLVQVVASDFDQLAASSTTRPWLQRTCNLLRCALPPWREPRALRMLQRDVRANPQRPGLLRISASFRNEALWAQPWPRLRIVLSDADGRAIAARDFAASEYLGTTPTANDVASGQVAGIAFDVVDPSPRVTAFTFEFR
ncbi:MAG: DUF3426 domain-containing protein [Thermomonas sp.]